MPFCTLVEAVFFGGAESYFPIGKYTDLTWDPQLEGHRANQLSHGGPSNTDCTPIYTLILSSSNFLPGITAAVWHCACVEGAANPAARRFCARLTPFSQAERRNNCQHN